MKQKIIVVKIGTKSIIEDGIVKNKRINVMAEEIIKIKKDKNISAVLVVSGAVELGRAILGLKEKPKEKIALQRCAGVGQIELMKIWSDGFKKQKAILSQYLLTYQNLESEKEQENIIRNLHDDIACGIIPIVNFNDKVDSQEVALDNDRLSAKIAIYSGASSLLILTNDVDGLMEADDLVGEVDTEDIEKYKKLCTGAGKSGTGGMRTKLEAADIFAQNGGECIIGNINNKIGSLLSGSSSGTRIKNRQNGG
ncbi:MAG: hypothetical protein WA063_03620 [Minisyncoccia bacterium]